MEAFDKERREEYVSEDHLGLLVVLGVLVLVVLLAPSASGMLAPSLPTKAPPAPGEAKTPGMVGGLTSGLSAGLSERWYPG